MAFKNFITHLLKAWGDAYYIFKQIELMPWQLFQNLQNLQIAIKLFTRYGTDSVSLHGESSKYLNFEVLYEN